MHQCKSYQPIRINKIVNERCTPEEQIHLALIFVDAVRQMPPQMREAWFDMKQFDYMEDTPVAEFCCTIERHVDGQFLGLFSTKEKSFQVFSNYHIHNS